MSRINYRNLFLIIVLLAGVTASPFILAKLSRSRAAAPAPTIVRVKQAENPSTREYFIPESLTLVATANEEVAVFERPLRMDKNFNRLTGHGQKMVYRLYAIEGVESVFVYPGNVNITIGDAFDWSHIDPQIKAAVHAASSDSEIVYQPKPSPPPVQVFVKETDSTDVIELHVNRQVSERLYYSGIHTKEEFEATGVIAKSIIKSLKQLPSVKKVSVTCYSVSVHLKDELDWTPQLEGEMRRIITLGVSGKLIPNEPMPVVPSTPNRRFRPTTKASYT